MNIRPKRTGSLPADLVGISYTNECGVWLTTASVAVQAPVEHAVDHLRVALALQLAHDRAHDEAALLLTRAFICRAVLVDDARVRGKHPVHDLGDRALVA